MKLVATFLVTAGLALVSFMGPMNSEHTEVVAPAEESFRIEVETDGNTVRLTCTQGCAWTELEWSCADRAECKSGVDFYGMRSQ